MVLPSKIKPWNLKNQAPAAARARLWMFCCISILHEKAIKNKPKLKENRSKTDLVGVLERIACWIGIGCHFFPRLRVSWDVLGASGERLGGISVLPRGVWARLGPSRARLGGILGRLGATRECPGRVFDRLGAVLEESRDGSKEKP